MGDVHDGVNFMRASCVIAVEKAKASFEPMLEALRHRAVHIMHRVFPAVEYMVRKGGSSLPLDTYNKPCQDMIRHIYDKFVELQVEECLVKCKDDLKVNIFVDVNICIFVFIYGCIYNNYHPS
jgi:hypothetical protein